MTQYKHIFILTGAGISAPSGIQTFRGSNGLWNGYNVEEVATPYAFEDNPNLVHNFYNDRRDDIRAKKPNAAHLALGELFEASKGMCENEIDTQITLVTQNIDDLHERGGFEETIHMHGEIFKKRCVDCWNVEDSNGDTSVGDLCSNCNGKIRPHIVWFGESPFDMVGINRCLKKCDLFISIGTSGQVAPASEFVEIAHRHGARTMEFNMERTAISQHFDDVVVGDVVETVPDWVSRFLQDYEETDVE